MRGFRNVLLLLALISVDWLGFATVAVFRPAFLKTLTHIGPDILIKIAIGLPAVLAAAVAGAGGVAFDSPRKLRWVTALAALLALEALAVWAVNWKLYRELSYAMQTGILMQVAFTTVGIYAGFAASQALTRGWSARDNTITVDG